MTWEQIIISVVSVALTALASWCVAKLTAFIDNKIKDTTAKNLLNSALSVVTDVVKQTYQTYVSSLKGNNAFTPEAQKEALTKASENIKNLLPEKMKNFIKDNFGDLEAWIATQIEATIYGLKK